MVVFVGAALPCEQQVSLVGEGALEVQGAPGALSTPQQPPKAFLVENSLPREPENPCASPGSN